MIKKVLIGVVALLALFFGYVSTRDGHFRYERHGVINAPADKIFPYLSQFKLGSQWSPYEQKDVNMKRTYSGTEGQVGSVMEFDGNTDVGSGKLEVLSIVPNEKVVIKLTMTKPFFGENIIEYTLTSATEGTQLSWSMSGDGGFIGKLMTLLIDCEKMVASDFEKGILNLKQVAEAQR